MSLRRFFLWWWWWWQADRECGKDPFISAHHNVPSVCVFRLRIRLCWGLFVLTWDEMRGVLGSRVIQRRNRKRAQRPVAKACGNLAITCPASFICAVVELSVSIPCLRSLSSRCKPDYLRLWRERDGRAVARSLHLRERFPAGRQHAASAHDLHGCGQRVHIHRLLDPPDVGGFLQRGWGGSVESVSM